MKYISILLTFLFASCEQVADQVYDEGSTSAYSTSSAPSSWRSTSQFPLTIKFGSNLTDNEKTAIANAASSWDETTDNQMQFFTFSNSSIDEKSNLNSYKDSEFGIYKAYTWPSDLPGSALAVTQIYGVKRNIGSASEYIEIEHADIILNFDYFSFSTDDSWGYDLTTVVLHEMGHFLGLYHSNTSYDTSVMYPSISRYVDNRIPKELDKNNILNKYRNRSSSSRSAMGTSTESEPVHIIYELHSNNKEIIKIKKGDQYEIINHTNHD